MNTKTYISYFILIALFLSPMCLFVNNVNASYWNTNFNFYKVITINHSYIDNDLTNFPVLIVIDDTTADKCNGGNSIRFIHSDETTEYYYEIEKWVDNEDRIVWVNVTFISSSVDTVFKMYYGNLGANDNQNPFNVWDSNYVGVWHMNDNITSDGVNDSTLNENTAVKENTPTQIVGRMGYGQDLNKNAGGSFADHFNLIYATSPNIKNTNKFTIEGWINRDAVNTPRDTIFSEWIGSTNTQQFGHIAILESTGYAFCRVNNGGSDKNLHDTVGFGIEWGYIAQTYDNNIQILYINGLQKASATIGSITINGNSNWKAQFGLYYGLYGTNGVLDEIRISNCSRSASWLKASFNCGNQTTGFISFGDEYEYEPNYAPLISNEIPANNSTNISLFPVLSIIINDPEGDNMTITWLSNVSGSWENIGYVLSNVNNGTYYQKFTEFAIYNLTYYWRVSVSDDYNIANNNVTNFTSELIPTISGNGNGNNDGEIGLLGIFGFLGFLSILVYKKYRG